MDMASATRAIGQNLELIYDNTWLNLMSDSN